ncbi:pyridoxamine 5'-phosphate oxidase family protein [Nocardioides sp. MAHUQ-72]|uniref:pyridoxamine 5'-phosphate oxidase family protein n=1 Tax=unclassified Nocardioides TaxID=2615069 RepID=UPI0036201AAB
MHEIIDMEREECERLLRAGVAGRIAISTPNGPHIVPVNYSVVDDAIVVRTSPYSLLGSYGRGTTLAFEVDQFDHENQRGWSVVARGRGEFVTDIEELDHIREVWSPRPWAGGSRTLYLRLRWTELSGRRVGAGWDPLSRMPVGRTL